MQEALLIIDVQNDYFPGGTCEISERIKPLPADKVIVKYFYKIFT